MCLIAVNNIISGNNVWNIRINLLFEFFIVTHYDGLHVIVSDFYDCTF